MTRILIIDSDATGRSALAQVFEDLGNAAVIASSPEEGVKAAFSSRPQAVLLHVGGRAVAMSASPFDSGAASGQDTRVRSGVAGGPRGSSAAMGELVQRLQAMRSRETMCVIAYSRHELTPSDSRLLFQAGVAAIVPASQVALLPEIVEHHLRSLQLVRDGAVAFARLRDDFHNLQRKLQEWVDTAVQDDVDRREIILNEIIASRPDGVLLVGADGKVVDADSGAESLLGGEMIGRSIGALVPASRLAAFLDAAPSAIRDRIVFDVAQLSHRPPRRLLASVVGLGSGDDSLRQRLVLLLDLSKRQRVEYMADAASVITLPASYQLRLLEHAHERCSLDALPCGSSAARRLHMTLSAASRHLRPVLLRGRPESARSRYAEILHHARRTSGPLLEVACDGLSAASQEIELFGERAVEGRSRLPGAIAQADGGTLVLHEVHRLSVACQERLAAVAKDPHIRLVATLDTGDGARDSTVAALVPSLAAAFAGHAVDIPPLAAMREDLPALISEGLGLDAYLRMTAEARAALLAWHWPQDRREFDLEVARLRTIRSRSIGLADLSSTIANSFTAARSDGSLEAGSQVQDAEDDSGELGWVELAPHVGRGPGAASPNESPSSQGGQPRPPAYPHADGAYASASGQRVGANGWVPTVGEWTITEEDPIDLNHYERKVILRALNAAGGNRTRAAEVLGVGKSTFYRKLAKLGLR